MERVDRTPRLADLAGDVARLRVECDYLTRFLDDLETLTSALIVRDPEDAGRCREAFERLEAAAVARALLERLSYYVRETAA